MAAVLVLFSILTFLVGLALFSASTTIFQEMLVGILFVVSSIFFTGGFIVATIDFAKSKHTELLTQIKDELRKSRLKKYPDKRPDDS